MRSNHRDRVRLMNPACAEEVDRKPSQEAARGQAEIRQQKECCRRCRSHAIGRELLYDGVKRPDIHAQLKIDPRKSEPEQPGVWRCEAKKISTRKQDKQHADKKRHPSDPPFAKGVVTKESAEEHPQYARTDIDVEIGRAH